MTGKEPPSPGYALTRRQAGGRLMPAAGHAALAGLLLFGCVSTEPVGQTQLTGDGSPLVAVAAPGSAGGRANPAAPAGYQPQDYSPEVFSGSYLAGLYAGTVQDTRAAADFFSEALERDPDNINLLRRTFILMLADGRVDETLALLNRYDSQEARGSVGRLTRYLDAMKKGQWQDARRELEGLSSIGFDALFGPLAEAWAEMGEGKVDAAIETVKRIGDKPVFVPFVEYHVALLNDLANRSEAAEAAYKQAKETQLGHSFRMVEAYGRFLEREGRPDDARKVYAEALERLPNNPLILKAIGRLDRGEKPPRLINRPEEGLAEALYTTASALAQDRAHESAAIYLQLAVFARPDFELAYILLARQFESAGRWEDALSQYAKITADSALGWEARFQVAVSLERLGRLDESVRLLKAMAAERTDDPAPIVLMGDLYRAREMYPEAAREYEAALERTNPVNSEHWILFYSRGVAYERTKRWSLAEVDFLRALELEPDQPLVLNYLGYSWIEKGHNIHQAREMVEKAVELRPNDGYVVDSLGWALYKLGKYKEATHHLERAVELRPQDPTINDHLGDAFWKVGRQIEARFQWRHALAFEPNKKLEGELRAKLQNGLGKDSSGS